jgi:hypothetical protein
VDDALTPPEAGAADDGEGDELLFTTPLRLLQAIDLAIQRVRAHARCKASGCDGWLCR